MSEREKLLLSFDFEDWHQLVLGRLALPGWDTRNAAFERQLHAILDFLDDVDASATFFLLGKTAKNYPELVREVLARGHEPACHGFGHERVFRQTRAEFKDDLERSLALIEDLTGRRPAGYRAPAFSVNRETVWAYAVLAELGFRWDSSQYDSPKIPHRLCGIPPAPYVLTEPEGARLLEIPLASRRLGPIAIPLGGGSYWRVLPRSVVLQALRRRDGVTALYFHPYEFDTARLHAATPPGTGARKRALAAYRDVRANPGRGRLRACLHAVAEEFKLTSYERALEGLLERHGSSTRALSEDGVLV